MKKKFRLLNKILNIVLTFVMMVGMLPLSTLTVFAGSSDPQCNTGADGSGIVWANGTPLYITQGTSDGLTAIYYVKGDTKTYLNPNGASGHDCSKWVIYGGSQKNIRLESDTKITMDGGSVKEIYGGSADSEWTPLTGNVEINLTGGSVYRVVGSCRNEEMDGNISINLNGAIVEENVIGVSGTVKGDVSIQMSSGSVGGGIIVVNDANMTGNCNITITGGTLRFVTGVLNVGYKIDGNATFLITEGATVSETVIPEAPNRVITGGLSGFIASGQLGSETTDKAAYFSDLVYKDGSTWILKGGAQVPNGITLNLASGESLLVGSAQSLTNNGTIVNNGTMTIDGSFVNKGNIQNNGTIIINGSYQNQGTVAGSGGINRNAAYISTDQSSVSEVYANGNQVSVTVEQVNGKLYLYGVTGNIKATLNGQNYYGNRSGSVAVELKPEYTAPSSIDCTESILYANRTYNLNELFTANETTFPLKWEYSVTNTENAEVEFQDNRLIAYQDCNLKINVSVNDTYNTFSEEFSFKVNTVPVEKLSFEIPSVIYLGQTFSLPKVFPENASYQNIEWSIEGECASVNNGSLKALAIGEFVLNGIVRNGLAYGEHYTISKKISVQNLDYIDVSVSSVDIQRKDDSTLIVTYAPFGTQYSNEEGKREYSAEDIIPISGGYQTETSNTITVRSGSPKIIIQDVCISTEGSPFTIADGASAQLKIEGINKLQSGARAAGLAIGSGSKVTIDGSGELECSSGLHAGIGCGDNSELTINGGTVTASSSSGAGIGGNNGGSGGTITINGGTVTASSSSGAGIGGGDSGGSGGIITINGGTVTASSKSGAGIGGGSNGSGGTITINGGTVHAISESNWAGAGIGGGYKGGAGNIAINGGTITASSSGSYAGAGIGTGGLPMSNPKEDNGIVTIRGGNINATSIGNGGDFSGCVVHNGTENGEEGVEKHTITLNGITQQVTVDSVEGIPLYYGLRDVKSIDGKLYLWFPSGQTITGVFAGDEKYLGTITGTSGELDLVIHQHNWEYTVTDTTIKAQCTVNDCDKDGDGGSITLNAANAYYTGGSIGAAVEGNFTNGATYNLTYNDGSENAPSGAGTHTAKLTVYENGTEKRSVTTEYKISYLDAPNPAYAISGAYENEGTYWFKTSATVNAPDGYTVSKAWDGEYGLSVSFDADENKVIYLKRSDGALTDAIKVVENIRFDTNGATGKITIESPELFWEKLLNKITFGLFFKSDVNANVAAQDTESGVKSIQYYVADEDLINNGDTSVLEAAIGSKWKDYSDKITLNKNAKNVIYVKIIDNVGNLTYLSSEGIAFYSDAEAVTESVSATYKAGLDKDVTVELNGNIVNAIKNDDDVLASGTDYNVSADGVITLKADYLDTLNAGTHTFTVSYNPLGETYVEAANNDAPATTTFKVVVEKTDGNVFNINVSSKTYDGTAVTAPTFDKLGDGAATIEYKVKGADDNTYSTTAPKNAGNYVVRVSIAEGTNYKATSATSEFSISKVAITVTADNLSKCYGESDPALTWSITNGALVNGEQLTGINLSRVSGENVSSYEIVVSQIEGSNPNYEITFEIGTFTINTKAVDATIVVNGAPFIYDGSKHEPEIVVKDGDAVISTDEYEVSYKDNIKAGTATVTIADKAGGNYEVNGSTTFIINKANPVIGIVSVDGDVKDSTNPSEVILTRADTTVDGVLKLTDDAMFANKSTYRWVFTPTDTDNYNVINGDVQIDVLDTVLPTAVIKVDTNNWKQFINNITFGLFFKETKEVTIAAIDNENGSGIKNIVYFVSDREYDADELQYVDWTIYTETFDIEPDGKYVVYAKVSDHDGNTVVINSDGLVIDETAAAVSGITDGETYYGQLVFTVRDDLAGVKSVVIDGNDKTHSEGQYTVSADNAEHTVIVTDNAGNVSEYKVTVFKNYTVTYYADGESISTETVGHGQDATLPSVPAKDRYAGKWDSDGKNITEDTAISVVYTELPDVSPDEVKMEDKVGLEENKEKLEEMLKDDSYFGDEKKHIQDVLDHIDEALEVIGNVEAVEEGISKLPTVDTVKPDDEEAIKAITDVQTAYNGLSDYEKSLVDEAIKATLDKLTAALVAYDIVEGDGSSWTEDSDHSITFVVNGLFSKFVGIKVDGKDVDKSNYEVKAGSTIITLKASYLDTLAVGTHTITVIYTDGETDGTFNVHAKANSPATGDNSNIWLWFTLLLVSGGAVITLSVVGRKRRTASKR